MVTSHTNGTLNLWEITFAEHSRFSQILSIGHKSRISGHKFRVNEIICHPLLPLMLTTSHNNLPDKTEITHPQLVENYLGNDSFFSELILWKVDQIGPLSKAGGLSELARINAPEKSAFSNVSWIPTVLPSISMRGIGNSPSACFVANDGQCLRVYQVIIDARTLLGELNRIQNKQMNVCLNTSNSTPSSVEDEQIEAFYNNIDIVSQQSTPKPGCILKLKRVNDAIHDWQNTQFLHVFPNHLIDGIDKNILANCLWKKCFYITMIEKLNKKSIIHMWKLSQYQQSKFQNTGTCFFF